MDEIATDERWHFTTEGSKTVTRTTYYFRASTILVAVMAALTAAMLLVAQEPAKAGVPIDDGVCLGCTTPPPGGWCGLIGCAPPPPPPTSEPVDTIAPSAPLIASPAEGSTFNVRSFTISGTAEEGSTVELFEGLVSKGTAQANTSGQWSINLTGISDGSHSYTAKAKDAAGNVSAESEARTVIVDTIVPTVTGMSPKPNTTGVSPTANVAVTFSEAMIRSSLTRTTLKLVRKGTTRAVGASLSYPAPNKVVLNPTDPLVRGATYRVTIVGGTSGAKDLAGNALIASVSWTFKVRA